MNALMRELKIAALEAPRLYFLPLIAAIQLVKRLASRP
jgi:hypothetical protein